MSWLFPLSRRDCLNTSATLPADSGARRVKDVLDSGEFPGPAVLRNLFVHLSLRFVLGCGDSGFHNCLIGEGVGGVAGGAHA